MQTKKLKEGMKIKNYLTLCELLKIEKKNSGSNSQNAQLRELERYCRYHREGQKFIIDEVYKKPLKKTESRGGGNNKVYVDDFKKLMVYRLHKDRSESLLMSKNALYKAMNLVNDNYSLAREKIPKLSEIIEVPTKAIYEFYDINTSKLTDVIERNLTSCRKQSLLIYETVTAVAINETVIATNELGKPIIDEKGKLIYTTDLKYRESTKEEKQTILKYENEVKKELGMQDNKQIFLAGKWRAYKKAVEKKLKEANTNIKFYYEAYKLTWNNKDIDKKYKEYFENEYVEDIQIVESIADNINSNISKSIRKSTKTRHTKAKNFSGFGDAIKKNNIEYRQKEEYVEEQDKLTKTLIDKHAKIFKDELKKEIDLDKFKQINENEQLEFNNLIDL